MLVCLVLLALPLRAQQVFQRQFGAADGLDQPFIYALAQDRQGYLWLATGEGAVRFDGAEFVRFTTRDGLAEDFVTRIYQVPGTDELWLGHYQGGATRLVNGKFSAVADPQQRPAGFLPTPGIPPPDTAGLAALRRAVPLRLPFEATVSATLRDRAGNLWLSTLGQGLWRITDPGVALLPAAPARLRPLAGPPVLPAAQRRQLPPTATVSVVRTAPDGSRWVGTTADGAYHFPADGGAVVAYTTANGLLHNAIYDILPDRAGRVWFATHDTGLAVLVKGSFHYFRARSGGLDASALAEDAAGRVWVGTEGQGVWRYDHGHLRRLSPAPVAGSAYCYGLLAYPGGDVLLVHRNALSRYVVRQRKFFALTSPANPLVRDCLPRAVALDSAGQTWVGTRGGVLRVAADVTGRAPLPPGLALGRAEVDGARRDPAAIGTLVAGAHRLTFGFRGVSLTPQEAIEYQYRLLGYQDAWSRPAPLAEAQFPRLDAGRFTFEARARRGAEGEWSAPVRVAFGIARPWWQQPLVWLVGGLLLLAAAWGVVRARTRLLRQQKAQLERTVRQRTAELRERNAEIEQINRDLVVARDAADASRRAKAQFLANMSHEIRTPMNAVIGLTYLLQRMPASSEQHEYLDAIQSSSQNLLTIINDILDSSKIEAGKLTLENIPFRLPDLLRRVGRMFAFAASSKDLRLQVSISPDVPAAVFGDPVRLSQILVNLVGNALKFTTKGGVDVAASARWVPAAEAGPAGVPAPGHWRVRLAVRDTGIGIAADKLDAIFEEFSQANTSTTRQFGGTGLGLSIARSLVLLHEGELHVESEEGVGTTFWFELPYLEADARRLATDASPELLPFAPPLRVLVAEDNSLNQLVARKTLEAWNVEVTVAANGRLAVEAASAAAATAAGPFDAVLMDVQMPEMDGYEATRQLRRYFPDAARFPIIGLTASALPEDRALALAAGMNDTLPKPFDPAVLYTRLAQLTGRQAAATDGPPPLARPEVTAPAASASMAPAYEPPAAAASEAPAPAAPAVAAARTPDLPVVDWQLLEELAMGNEGFIQQAINTFLHEAPLLLAELQAAAAERSRPRLAAAAHRLRGQAAYFGADSMLEVLEDLEQPPPNLAEGDVWALVAHVEPQFRALLPPLHARLAGQLTHP